MKETGKGWSIAAALGLAASVIGIWTFVSGRQSLDDLLRLVGLRSDSETQAPTTPAAEPNKSELDLVLDSCSHVPPGVARFVVIPATPGRVQSPEYTLTFTGALSDRVASTRYAVLRQGLDIGALRLYQRRYTVLLADPASHEVIASFGSSGVGSFDVEKHRVEEALVAFLEGSEAEGAVDWGSGATTAALDGRCNLLNLVILPVPAKR